MSDDNKNIDINSLSDDEILNMSVDSLPDGGDLPPPGKEDESNAGPGQDPGTAASASGEDDPGKTADEPGGAGTAGKPEDRDPGKADSISDEEFFDLGNDAAVTGDPPKAPVDNQSQAKPKTDPEAAKAPKEDNVHPELKRLFEPFRASGRTVQVDNIDDARRLMQFGIDYNHKMSVMKPYLRVMKTLEKNDLLDEGKINFMVDLLHKKDPAAIRKFFRDNEVDPMDLNSEGDTEYRPTDHMVSDGEVELDDVLNDIRGTSSFERTIDVITNQWDKASKDVLLAKPKLIKTINAHVNAGLFDIVMDKVATLKALGKLEGLSDLQAYKVVGDAIKAENGFKQPASNARPSTDGTEPQGTSQDAGSDPNEEERNRRRAAAAATQGKPTAGKQKINLGALSDDEILKINPATL